MSDQTLEVTHSIHCRGNVYCVALRLTWLLCNFCISVTITCEDRIPLKSASTLTCEDRMPLKSESTSHVQGSHTVEVGHHHMREDPIPLKSEITITCDGSHTVEVGHSTSTKDHLLT